MDTTTRERDIIKQAIQRYAQFKPSHGDIRLDTVFDDTQSRYALMQVGWDRGRRVRGNLIYVTLSEDKVWVEYDATATNWMNQQLEALHINITTTQ